MAFLHELFNMALGQLSGVTASRIPAPRKPLPRVRH